MKNFLVLILSLFALANSTYSQTLSIEDSGPVRVSYFNATSANNNKTRLNWKVVCFLQYANFEVQRSTNGTDYTTINTFTADRFRCQSPFDFEDPVSSTRTYYRLKVGDKDGNFSTSKVVVAFGKVKSFEINNITPNLISSRALLSISSVENDRVNVAITNFNGLVIKRIVIDLNKGVTDIPLDLNSLPKGQYVLTATNSTSYKRTTRFAKM